MDYVLLNCIPYCLLDVQHACLTIQSAYRGMKVRKLLANQYTAATKIQAAYRRYKVQSQYQQKYWCIIRLQRSIRSHLYTKRTEAMYKRTQRAVVTLQKAFIQYRLRKRTTAVIYLQKHVRRFLCRSLYKQKREACITVQRRYREKIQAQTLHQQYLLMKQSAIILQSAFRTYRVCLLFSLSLNFRYAVTQY